MRSTLPWPTADGKATGNPSAGQFHPVVGKALQGGEKRGKHTLPTARQLHPTILSDRAEQIALSTVEYYRLEDDTKSTISFVVRLLHFTNTGGHSPNPRHPTYLHAPLHDTGNITKKLMKILAKNKKRKLL